MVKSLEALGAELSVEGDNLSSLVPGQFVEYIGTKNKSSEVSLASTGGVISKTKKRSSNKTIYEYLSLELLHRTFSEYSANNDLNFVAPRPVAVSGLDLEESTLYMTYLPGYELVSISQNLRRTFPVILPITGQTEPLPLYPAVAVYLGGLAQLMENEGVLHDDLVPRHIIFQPQERTSIGIIDLENSHF